MHANLFNYDKNRLGGERQGEIQDKGWQNKEEMGRIANWYRVWVPSNTLRLNRTCKISLCSIDAQMQLFLPKIVINKLYFVKLVAEIQDFIFIINEGFFTLDNHFLNQYLPNYKIFWQIPILFLDTYRRRHW